MQTGSSPPLFLSEKTKNRPSAPPLSPSTPKMVQGRRKGNEKIDDPKKREVTCLKRINGLKKKAKDLNSLTDSPVAVIMVNPTGKLSHFGGPSVEEVFLMYLRDQYGSKLPMSPKEGVDWAEEELDSCATKEQCASLIIKHLDPVVRLLKKFKDLENNPSSTCSAVKCFELDLESFLMLSKDKDIQACLRG